jgi:tetratricopeptide (TPR) repeat protein
VNRKPPLKTLAADHAKEALKALSMGLPSVAIHHLRKAVDLVPLDVVLGYWLARLLVATGRRRQCVEGRLIALRCVKISAGEDEERELETMACLVIAARASERLGELEVAREHARMANDKTPYHWLAKLEYGRQLAFGGDKVVALKLAEEAFWLRPQSILRIQADAAFRSLGGDFSGFRAKLRKTVIEETDEIASVEGLVREFAAHLGTVQGDPVQEPSDVAGNHQQTINQLVHNGYLSLKSSCQILQQAAVRLSVLNDSFMFNSEKGLTPAMKVNIAEAIRTQEAKVATAKQQYNESTTEAKHLQKRRTTIVGGGVFGGLVLSLIAVMAIYVGAAAPAVLLIVIIVLGTFMALSWHQSLGSRHSTVQETIDKDRYELEQINHSLAELNTTMRNFEVRESQLRESVATFCNLVDRFERKGLKRISFSPAPPIDRKGTEDLLRAETAKLVSLGLEFDAELLPMALRFLAASGPKSKYWLARRVKTEATETLSRSAAYFDNIRVITIYLFKDGSQIGPFTIAHVKAWLTAGEVRGNDQAWYEGASGWMPLSSVPGFFEW